MPRTRLFASLVAVATLVATPALAQPTDPVLIGWWSYFDYTKVPTVGAAHPVTSFGDPDTYYYEPSGGFGLQENPAVLPTAQAWDNLVSYILAQSGNVTLQPTFTRDESSDLSQWTQAYFGWALALLYVPKEKFCDQYQIHVGAVDDGVQAMASMTILGYQNLGDPARRIDIANMGSPNALLRPGINQIVLIHEDQAAVQRYVRDVWVEHQGTQVPLAPKSIVWGRVTDAASGDPKFEATVTLTGAGLTDTFLTGPLGFYFFAGLADGAYTIAADAGGYQTQTQPASVALGQAMTEVARVDLALTLGCNCPDGTGCGASGGCLPKCETSGEFGVACPPGETGVCVQGLCVKNPCDTLICDPGFACQDGTCVEISCTNVCCGAGQICSGGLCVSDGCGAGCGAGQVCAGGACVPGCDVITCVPGLECKDGSCLEECAVKPELCAPDAGVFLDGGLGIGGTGASGAGGTGGGASGAGGSSTPSRGSARPATESGCACAATGRDTTAAGLAALAALALVRVRRRRR